MQLSFFIDYTDWRGERDTFWCHASTVESARSQAYWALGDLIEIHSIEWM